MNIPRRWEKRGDDGLGHMCDFGIDNYEEGMLIQFNVLSQKEVDFVRHYMAIKAPHVRYETTRARKLGDPL